MSWGTEAAPWLRDQQAVPLQDPAGQGEVETATRLPWTGSEAQESMVIKEAGPTRAEEEAKELCMQRCCRHVPQLTSGSTPGSPSVRSSGSEEAAEMSTLTDTVPQDMQVALIQGQKVTSVKRAVYRI